MENLLDLVKSSNKNGTSEEIEAYITSNPSQFYKSIDDCFVMLENSKNSNEGIDNIYLLVNSLSFSNNLTESTIDRLFEYYIEKFSELLNCENWHFFNVSLDLLGTNADVFPRNEIFIDHFVEKSMQLLNVLNVEVGSDLDVAVDSFLNIVFNVKHFDKNRMELLKFADDHPENSHAEEIYEAARG